MIYDGNHYTINYAKAATDTNLLASTRSLAKQLMENPYITIGHFIQDLSSGDIQALMDTIEDEHPNQYEDMIIITEMLSLAEGCDESQSEEEANDRISQMTMFLVIESLARKGMVKVYYENMSFHPDSGDKVVVEKI
jgi:hypothetical protein